jgi:hypothetical protein
MLFAQIEALDVVRKASQAEIAALSGTYTIGRFYEVIGTNQLRRALSPTQLSEPIVFGTADVDALSMRVTALETNSVTKEVFEANKQAMDAVIGSKFAIADFTNYQGVVVNSLNNKLGKTEKAVDSTLFDGHTYTELQAAYTAADAAQYNLIMQAVAQNVGNVFSIDFAGGQVIDASKLDIAAGQSYANLPNHKYMFVLNGTAGAKANMINYAGLDATPQHEGTNNDHYIVTVVNGAVTSIARRNDTTSDALIATNAVMTAQGQKILTLEQTTGENGVTKVGNKYILGGTITQDTTFVGQKFVNFKNTLLADDLRLRDIDTGVVWRVAIQSGKWVYGIAPIPN